MQQVVSITSQGQVSLPQAWLKKMGITGPVKAVLRQERQKIILEPKQDFWSLAASLKSDIKASDQQLKQARKNFSKKWHQI